MGNIMAAVLVLPPDHQPDQIVAAMPTLFAGATRFGDRAWDLLGLSDAHLTLTTNPVGFDLLILRFSSNEYARGPETLERRLGGFTALGLALDACFGFVTLYDAHLERTWLENHVLVPLLSDEHTYLQGLPFLSILIEPGRTGRGQPLNVQTPEALLRSLSNQLRLNYEPQDWGIVNADGHRLTEFILFFENNLLAPTQRFHLAELVLASANERLLAGDDLDHARLTNLIKKNAESFGEHLNYWKSLSNDPEFPLGKILSQDL